MLVLELVTHSCGRLSTPGSSSASHTSPSSLLPGSCAPSPPAYFYFLNAQLYRHVKLLLPRAFSHWVLQGRLLLWPQPFSFYPNRRNTLFAKSLLRHSLSGKLLLFEIILVYVFFPQMECKMLCESEALGHDCIPLSLGYCLACSAHTLLFACCFPWARVCPGHTIDWWPLPLELLFQLCPHTSIFPVPSLMQARGSETRTRSPWPA